MNPVKVGRNQHCPCGSQKKFKHCCLNQDLTLGDEESEVSNGFIEKMQNKNFTIVDDKSQLKMSEIILDLAQYLLEEARTKSARRMAIEMTCIAWNIAIVSEKSSLESELNALFKHMNIKKPDEQKDIAEIISGIIENKKRFYPSVKRLIVDYEVVDTKNELSLNIASSFV